MCAAERGRPAASASSSYRTMHGGTAAPARRRCWAPPSGLTASRLAPPLPGRYPAKEQQARPIGGEDRTGRRAGRQAPEASCASREPSRRCQALQAPRPPREPPLPCPAPPCSRSLLPLRRWRWPRCGPGRTTPTWRWPTWRAGTSCTGGRVWRPQLRRRWSGVEVAAVGSPARLPPRACRRAAPPCDTAHVASPPSTAAPCTLPRHHRQLLWPLQHREL